MEIQYLPLTTKTYESQEIKADLIIGADGAFSALRKSLQNVPLFDYSQSYIEQGYLELCIPRDRNNRMTPNHLHIWPRGEFMMIALPNRDESWTVTLFMSFERFKKLKDGEKVVDFFTKTFPDAVGLIGENELMEVFLKNDPSPLVSVKCKPHHFGSRFLLLGDAAHAMVPFYGQGMNAGFEDCVVLNELLDKSCENIREAVEEYSEQRVGDLHAICDLAMYNYVEMRDLVTRPTYHLRKTLDTLFHQFFPRQWLPLYHSVCFSHMSYSACVENRNWQNKELLLFEQLSQFIYEFTMKFVDLFLRWFVCLWDVYGLTD
ncbi:hypothetical protein NQ318_011808 [Aromia moschata]|uniref:FAD-binding domain-containing protein n=1 Tax=Aromia moschata TaxID=1265417 RepID=A0AAV8Y4I8_9CUCU|nr:hypothetical protein NQ318_011808 [Aromia moschata]